MYSDMVSLLSLDNIWRVKSSIHEDITFTVQKKLHWSRNEDPILDNTLPTGEWIGAEAFLIYTKLLHLYRAADSKLVAAQSLETVSCVHILHGVVMQKAKDEAFGVTFDLIAISTTCERDKRDYLRKPRSYEGECSPRYDHEGRLLALRSFLDARTFLTVIISFCLSPSTSANWRLNLE